MPLRWGATARPRILLACRHRLTAHSLARLLTDPPLSADVSQVAVLEESSLPAQAGFDLVMWHVEAEQSGDGRVEAQLAAVPGRRLALLVDPDDEPNMREAMRSGTYGCFAMDTQVGDLVSAVGAVLNGYPAYAGPIAITVLGRRERPAESASPAASLTGTEREILAQLSLALPLTTIAGDRGISIKTVRNHISSIYRKLSLKNRAQAQLYARQMGMADGLRPPAEPTLATAGWAGSVTSDYDPAAGRPGV